MAKIRCGRSDDKYKQDRENSRLGMATYRKNQSEQRRETEKAMDAVRKSTSRKNQSEQKRETENAKSAVRMSTSRKNQSKQEREAENAMDAVKKSISRKNQSDQKREAEKAKNAKTKRDKRQKESPEEANSRRSKRATPSSPAVDSAKDRNILSENTIKKCKKTALKYLHRTLDAETGMHQSHVCVVCDCFILGTQKSKRLNKNQLKVHENRLSIDQYMSFHRIKEIQTSLRDHYKVSGFPKMLLSPRSNLKRGKDILAVNLVLLR